MHLGLHKGQFNSMSCATFRVGDRVQFRVANEVVVGQIREDRGPIGVAGRRLYGVAYEMGKDNWYYIELPAIELKVIEPAKETA
jgi:hypothetical protein